MRSVVVLPGAVRAEEAGHRARLDGEVQVGHGAHRRRSSSTGRVDLARASDLGVPRGGVPLDMGSPRRRSRGSPSKRTRTGAGGPLRPRAPVQVRVP